MPPPPPLPPHATITPSSPINDKHAKAIRACVRSDGFSAANKLNIANIAATANAICAGSVSCSVRGLSKPAAGNVAVAGTETINATVAPAAEVVAGFGTKLHVIPAGGLLQESCTTPPALPTAFRFNWYLAVPPALIVLTGGTVEPKDNTQDVPTR